MTKDKAHARFLKFIEEHPSTHWHVVGGDVPSASKYSAVAGRLNVGFYKRECFEQEYDQMTDKNEPMTLERALELAIYACNYNDSSSFNTAAAVLRDGEPVKTEREEIQILKCLRCGAVIEGEENIGLCCDGESAVTMEVGKQIVERKTRRVLEPVTVTSEPVFEEVYE